MLKGVARGIGAQGAQGAQGPQGAQGAQGAQGGGGMVIGDPVTGATPNCVLFVDADGNLAQDAGFTFASHQLFITHDQATIGVAAAGSSAYAQMDVQLGYFGIYATNAAGSKSGDMIFSDDGDWVIKPGSDRKVSIMDGVNPVAVFDTDSYDVTIASLAGVGTRAVVVDANGKLSAP